MSRDPVIPEEFLNLLACPACADRPPLERAVGGLVCSSCARLFKVTDSGIPLLVVENESEALDARAETENS